MSTNFPKSEKEQSEADFAKGATEASQDDPMSSLANNLNPFQSDPYEAGRAAQNSGEVDYSPDRSDDSERSDSSDRGTDSR